MSASNKGEAPASLRMNDLLQGVGTPTRAEFNALVRSVINLQNVVRNVMSVMDENQTIANDNAANMNQNCLNLLDGLRVVAGEVGITNQGINDDVETALDLKHNPQVKH